MLNKLINLNQLSCIEVLCDRSHNSRLSFLSPSLIISISRGRSNEKRSSGLSRSDGVLVAVSRSRSGSVGVKRVESPLDDPARGQSGSGSVRTSAGRSYRVDGDTYRPRWQPSTSTMTALATRPWTVSAVVASCKRVTSKRHRRTVEPSSRYGTGRHK